MLKFASKSAKERQNLAKIVTGCRLIGQRITFEYVCKFVVQSGSSWLYSGLTASCLLHSTYMPRMYFGRILSFLRGF